MQYRHSLSVFSLIIIWCVSVAVLAAPQSSVQQVTDTVPESWDTIGDILLRGRIVTEDGTPVDQVTIEIMTSYRSPSVISNRIETETSIVDGGFVAECRRCLEMDLSFSKTGYFQKRMQFAAADPRSGRFGGLVKTDVVVILARIPLPAPLDKISGELRASINGPVSVVEISPGSRYAIDVNSVAKCERGGGPFVLLEIDSMGKPETARGNTSAGQGQRSSRPTSSAVRFSSEGSGFSVFSPNCDPVFQDECFRQMMEAPVSGYDPRLEITSQDDDYIYFFFVVDGKYGKGRITVPYFRDDSETTVAAPIILLQNPTGSTYVATAR